MHKSMKVFGVSFALASLLLAGCSNDDTEFVVFSPVAAQTASPSPIPAASILPVITAVQVEQLARPAINEGLLVTNSFLNTYNAVSPAFIRAALTNPTGPEGTAAAPVLAEAAFVLSKTVALNTTLTPTQVNATVGALVGALLPDVMRIDTTVNISVGQEAYNSTLNTAGAPVAGRKLTDDVIDTTLTVVTQGAVKTDNVPYYRPTTGAGSNNTAIGHDLLNGQTTPNGPATFPFLAPAN